MHKLTLYRVSLKLIFYLLTEYNFIRKKFQVCKQVMSNCFRHEPVRKRDLNSATGFHQFHTGVIISAVAFVLG